MRGGMPGEASATGGLGGEGVSARARAVSSSPWWPAERRNRRQWLHHLDLQLAEFLSGRLASLHTLTATPSSLRSVGGVVQEWVSHEVGVVRLDEEDGGVALFHIGQAWAYKSCWVPYTSVMTKPAHLDYLALGTSVLLAVR